MKILLLGAPPPPLQPDAKLEAINYRTWQFIQPLLEDGYEVCLGVSGERASRWTDALGAPLRWEALPFQRALWMPQLQRLHDEFKPDAIVAVDFYPALWATRLKTDRPIWMDLYGDPLTIMQVARHRGGNDQGIGTAITLMASLLEYGDVFSTCGLPQKHMMVGELAMAGRLNSRSFGYDFVRPVYPGALPPAWTQTAASSTGGTSGLNLPADAFVVLWCGGYNSWTDVETLARGLEAVLERNERVHFVSVGASTYPGENTVYDRFIALSRQARHAGRFHLLGWRPWQDVPHFYRLSHVGLNIDALHYETLYGTRTRLLEMLAYGLPVITSEGCELSYLIPQRQVGYSFASGDWQALAASILQLADNPAQLAAMRDAAVRLTHDDLSFRTTTEAFRAWVAQPTRAPDHQPVQKGERLQQTKYRLRTAARTALWQLGLSGQRRAS